MWHIAATWKIRAASKFGEVIKKVQLTWHHEYSVSQTFWYLEQMSWSLGKYLRQTTTQYLEPSITRTVFWSLEGSRYCSWFSRGSENCSSYREFEIPSICLPSNPDICLRYRVLEIWKVICSPRVFQSNRTCNSKSGKYIKRVTDFEKEIKT